MIKFKRLLFKELILINILFILLFGIANIKALDSLGTENPNRIIVSVGEDPSKSLTFNWETNLNTTQSEVIIGLKADLSDGKKYISDKTYTPTISHAGIQKSLRTHEVSINGLSPDTKYYYKVGDGTTFSPIKSVKTVKDEGKIKALYYTDPQSGNVSNWGLLDNIYQEAQYKMPDLDFAFSSGDIIDQNNYDYWSYFDEGISERFGSMPHATGYGNHDALNNAMYKASYGHPENGVEGLEKTNYFFEAGEALFLFLDSESSASYANLQKAWLREVVNKSNKQWKIAVMHRGPYYISTYYNQTVKVYEEIFDELGIDMVFYGHEHKYQRTVVSNKKFGTTGQGTTYVVGGASGAKFYTESINPLATWPVKTYGEKNQCYVLLDYDAQGFNYKAYTVIDGVSQELDSFSLTKKAKFFNTDTTIAQSGSLELMAGTFYNDENVLMKANIKYNLKNTINGVTINESILKVSDTVPIGTIVTVSAIYGTLSMDLNLTVVEGIPKSLSIDNTQANVFVNNPLELKATVLNSTGLLVEKEVRWTLRENLKGVSINDGKLLITEEVADQTVITLFASINDLKKEYTVVARNYFLIVTDIIVTSKLKDNKIALGKETALEAKLILEDGSSNEKGINWRLKEEISGVSLDEEGNLTVAKTVPKNTKITAIAFAGNLEKEIIITVKSNVSAAIYFIPAGIILIVSLGSYFLFRRKKRQANI